MYLQLSHVLRLRVCIVLYTSYSYEQLTHIHPEIDDYKLYYAQVRMSNVCLVCVLCVCVCCACVCVCVHTCVYVCVSVHYANSLIVYTLIVHIL